MVFVLLILTTTLNAIFNIHKELSKGDKNAVQAKQEYIIVDFASLFHFLFPLDINLVITMSTEYLQHWRRLIEIESRMLDESSLSNSERTESNHCEVEDNDIHVASYTDLSQIPQGENELNKVLDFCNSYSSCIESDSSVLNDPPGNIARKWSSRTTQRCQDFTKNSKNSFFNPEMWWEKHLLRNIKRCKENYRVPGNNPEEINVW